MAVYRWPQRSMTQAAEAKLLARCWSRIFAAPEITPLPRARTKQIGQVIPRAHPPAQYLQMCGAERVKSEDEGDVAWRRLVSADANKPPPCP